MKKFFTLFVVAFIIHSFKAGAQTDTSCNIQPSYTWQLDTRTANTVDFTNTTAATGTTVNWFFGDDSASTLMNPVHTYAQPGKYYACLRVQFSPTCYKYQCDTITVPSTTECNIQPSYTWQLDTRTANTVDFTNTTVATGTTVNWFFGDDSASTLMNPTHTYAQPGKYYACLRVQFSPTCYKYQCDTITVPSTTECNIQPSYTWQLDTRTANTVDFTNTTVATGTTVNWFFGDDSASTLMNPTHTYAQPGKYYACLRVQFSPTCYKYQCDTITVPSTTECNIQPSYTWQLDTRTANTVDFTNTTVATGTTVNWFFGDDSASTLMNPTHTYAQPGKYYACLRVQFSPTCYKYQCDTITVPSTTECNIQPSYTWQLDTRTANTVDFTNTTVATGTTVNWFFGDDSASTLMNPTHTYAQPGKYYACLRVQFSPTCYKYQCDTITVPSTTECNIQPSYTWQLDTRTANTVDFTNTTVATGTTVNWFFGDDSASTLMNPTHTYAQPGKYYACLRVQFSPTCYKYQCDTITVPSTTECNIQPSYTWQLDTRTANTVDFTNTTVATGTTVNWFFGDDSASTLMNPTHTYAQPGKYYACLRVQFSPTCYKYQCDTITVPSTTECNIQPSYTWQLDTRTANTVDFTNTTVATGTTVNWFFGDDSASTLMNPTHTYAQPGKYYACLRVQFSPTCYKYQCDTITVPSTTECNIQPSYTWQLDTRTANTVDFTNTTVATGTTINWFFGDDSASTLMNPTHTYAQPGKYYACLRVQFSANCYKYQCDTIIIPVVNPNVNCDSNYLTYNYYKDGNIPNKIYFYTTDTFPLSQQSWSITSLTNAGANPIFITQTNPEYVFNDTGYYSVCLNAIINSNCIKEYCDTIHIETIATPYELQVYPNPANTQAEVNIQLSTPELIYVSLYNIQGMLLSRTDQPGSNGANIVTINTQNLVAGFYTIELTYGDRTCFAKFQKL